MSNETLSYMQSLEALRRNPDMRTVLNQWREDLKEMGLRMMYVTKEDFPHWQGRMAALNEIIETLTEGAERRKISPETGSNTAPPGFF